MEEERKKDKTSKQKTLVTWEILCWVFISFVFVFVASGVTSNLFFFHDFSLTASVLIIFLVLVILFHLIAYFSRNKISKIHLHILEYVYLSLATLGLVSVISVEVDFAEIKIDYLSLPYVKNNLETVISMARLYKEDTCREGTLESHKTYLSSPQCIWFTDAVSLLEKEYNSSDWLDFINKSRSIFNTLYPRKVEENEPRVLVLDTRYGMSDVLSQMVEYREIIDSRNKLYKVAKGNSEYLPFIRYCGVWSLVVSLSLRITKLTIDFAEWEVIE